MSTRSVSAERRVFGYVSETRPTRASRGSKVVGIYEIHLQGKRVSIRDAGSAHLALLDHVRDHGGREEDIVRLGSASLSWRGAVYTAVRTAVEPVRVQRPDLPAGYAWRPSSDITPLPSAHVLIWSRREALDHVPAP